MLVQNLTKKVGDGEEKYSLLKEQNDSFRELLVTERAQFEEKENMYKQNVSCTFRLWLNFIKLTALLITALYCGRGRDGKESFICCFSCPSIYLSVHPSICISLQIFIHY